MSFSQNHALKGIPELIVKTSAGLNLRLVIRPRQRRRGLPGFLRMSTAIHSFNLFNP